MEVYSGRDLRIALGRSSGETRSLFYLHRSLYTVVPSLRTPPLDRSFDLARIGRLSSQPTPRVELERLFGRWTAVLVFSGYVLHWRRGTSGPQSVGRQGTCGRATGVRLAVLRGARGAACLARYAGAWPRGQHRARAARGGICSGGRWRRDDSRGGCSVRRNGPDHGRAARW